MKLLAALSLGAVGAMAVAERPIRKVIDALEDMMHDSKKEGKTERELYAKYKCYCDTNTKETNDNIARLTDEIALLSADIEKLQGQSGELSMQVAQLSSDMAANEEARNQAQTIRDKAKEEFEAADKDMGIAIDSMNAAIDTLSAIGADQTESSGADHAHQIGQGKGSFLAKTRVVRLTQETERALKLAAEMNPKHEERSLLFSFVQQHSNGGGFTDNYTAQSGAIVGILKNMRDTFKENKANAIAAEQAAVEAHEKFMKTKEEEHDEMSKSYDDKQEQLGANDEELASKKSMLSEAETNLADDQEFLATLTENCEKKAAQYEDRKAIRAKEQAAVSEAISILSSDDAFATFGKTTAAGGATSFMQVSRSVTTVGRRAAAMTSLLAAARSLKSLRAAKAAMMLQAGNPFAKVLIEIEKMIEVIDKEEKADDEKFEWCDKEQTSNEADKVAAEDKISNLKDEIKQLNLDIEELEKKIAEDTASLAENRKNQAAATTQREKENKAYQADKANLQSAQEIMNQALETLKDFYKYLHAKEAPHHYASHDGKNSKGGLIRREPGKSTDELKEICSNMHDCVGFDSQGNLKNALTDAAAWYDAPGTLYIKVYDTQGPSLLEKKDRPDAPETFDDEYSGQKESGNAVLNLLSDIIDDTKAEEEAADKEETESLEAYEKEMEDLKKSEKGLEESINESNKTKSEKEQDLLNTEATLKDTEKELAEIIAYLAEIEPGCTFIQDNIDLRKKNREAESGALKNAIELIKGTPAYQAAEAKKEQLALGKCREICNSAGKEHAECQACLNEVSVPGWCAGHPSTPGC